MVVGRPNCLGVVMEAVKAKLELVKANDAFSASAAAAHVGPVGHDELHLVDARLRHDVVVRQRGRRRRGWWRWRWRRRRRWS